MRLLPAPAVYRCYVVVVCSQKYAFLLVRSGLIPYRAPLSDHPRMKRYHCSLVVRQVAIKELNVSLEELLSQPAFRSTQISGMGRYDNLKPENQLSAVLFVNTNIYNRDVIRLNYNTVGILDKRRRHRKERKLSSALVTLVLFRFSHG